MKKYRAACLALSALIGGTVFQPVTALAVGFEILKPHRAVYDVKLKDASERSGIDNMTGRIVYEMTGNECEGIAVNYRFVSKISSNGEIFTTDQQTASHESPDSNQYSFLTKSFVDEQLDRTVKGVARIRSGHMVVELDSPEERLVKLDPAAFISTHLVKVIEAARTGEHFFSLDVFDGGDDADEVLSTTNIIGAARDYPKVMPGEKPDAVDTLGKLKAWPVTIGYFRKGLTDSTEPLPIYEISFLLYEGGISRRLTMRYPDYAINAALVSLEMLEDTGSCSLKN